MNSFLKIVRIIVILGLAVSLYSCGENNSSNQESENADTTINQSVASNDSTETYYLIPSPEELFRFIKDGKLKFSETILNPTANIDKYIDTRSKELNFGVYSADLAYVASFNKYQESINYLGVVRNLSNEIGISSVFDKSLIGRIDNIIDDQDSLLRVTNDTYLSIVSYLETANRKKSLANIVSGGWIESIYVVTNLLENYNENPKIISLLASQKIVVENLMNYLKDLKDDSNIEKTINLLQPLANFYQNLKVKEGKSENTNTNKKSGDKIIVGGNNEVIMTAEDFEVLKAEITKIRSQVTNK